MTGLAADQSARGSELLLAMDPISSLPMHTQLERALREAIRTGRFAAGTRLPASRALAAELGCSRWVIVEAYQQHYAEGCLRTRAGRGAVVIAPPTESDGTVINTSPASA